MQRSKSITHRLKTILPLILLTTFILAASPPQLPITNDHLSITNPSASRLCSICTALGPRLQSPNLPISQSPNHTNYQAPITQTTTPQIEVIINLGVPAGNGAIPKHLALDSEAGQLYILSEGLPILKQGTGLSVYNLKTGEIDDHVKIIEGNNEALDLQVDPASGLIYALWNEQFSDTRPTLTVIDSQSLEAVQDIPEIEAFATGAGRLYAANAEELISVNLANNSLAQAQRLELPSAGVTGPMAVSPATNRLYVARNVDGLWSMEIFEAGTLIPVGSYPSTTQILNILPLPGADQVLVVVAQDNFRTLYRLTTDGELADLPYELGPRFGAAGIALSQDEERLYYSNGELRPIEPTPGDTTGPALAGIAGSPDLSPLQNIPLLTNVDDLAIDDQTNQAFALYPFDHFLYVIDLDNETVEIVNTAIELRDVLVDSESNQIFVSDTANRIRILDPDTLEVLAKNKLQDNMPDYGFKSVSWGGELTLDRDRNRLYVSGFPATVLEADTLAESGNLEPGGQLAPDPTSDEIYLSQCGVTILEADTLSGETMIAGSGRRPDGLSPNPCVGYSKLDVTNQLLYSLVPNGVPGSNSGSYLYVYDLDGEPTLVYSDTEISTIRLEPEPTGPRAFTNYTRHSNQRVRALDLSLAKPFSYTHQLMGVRGDTRYSPTTDRLYLGNRDHDRLLTLEAGTLTIIDELLLPANYNYRLAGLDLTDDRLYFIGFDGQLLVASSDASAALSLPPAPAREPNGKIAALENTGAGDILARIDSQYDNTPDTRLYRSSDEGQSWTDLSRNHTPFPVQTMAVDDNSQTLFVGLLAFGQTGGLYQSTDGGESWLPAMAGLQDLWVEKLYISPDFEETGLIFAKTSHGGLHHSTDAGQTWSPLLPTDPAAPFPTTSHSTAVAFDGQGQVLAGQSLEEMNGIFRATPTPTGTLSAWEQVLDQPVSLMAYSPDGTLALAFGSGLWRSLDGGQSWEAGGAGLSGVENLQADRFLFSPDFADDETIYFFFKDFSSSAPAQLFRSTDAGQSWQPWVDPVSDGDDSAAGNNFTAVSWTSDGDFIFGDANTQLTRLSPSALRWQDSTGIATRFPLHDLAASPGYDADQTVFALSSEYGLFKSTNGGRSWQLTGFPARTYRVSSPSSYRLAISPAYEQDQTLYVSTGRSLHRSTDSGESWQQLQLMDGKAPEQTLSFPVQRVALAPDFGRSETMLASAGGLVYRSTNGGDTWQPALTPDEAGNADLLRFAPDGDTVYARFGYGYPLFTSTDGSQSWQAQPSLTRDEYFSFVDSTTATGGTLTGALEFDKRLLQTDPQSLPWNEISESLPSELSGLNTITYGPDDTLYIGGQGGIFSSSDNGQSWQQPANTGLPLETKVTKLYATDTHLFAVLADGSLVASSDDGDSWSDISVIK